MNYFTTYRLLTGEEIMCLCGFNEKMLEGMTKLHYGIISGENTTGGDNMFCGFNQKMAEGLDDFQKELVTYGLIERSNKNNRTIDDSIKKELKDMKNFLEEARRIEDPLKRQLIVSLVNYVSTFYELVQNRGFINYPEVIKNISNLYFEMDRKFYGELEGRFDDMKHLTEYLNTIKI
jgi:hypothetical protein